MSIILGPLLIVMDGHQSFSYKKSLRSRGALQKSFLFRGNTDTKSPDNTPVLASLVV